MFREDPPQCCSTGYSFHCVEGDWNACQIDLTNYSFQLDDEAFAVNDVVNQLNAADIKDFLTTTMSRSSPHVLYPLLTEHSHVDLSSSSNTLVFLTRDLELFENCIIPVKTYYMQIHVLNIFKMSTG